MVGSAGSDVSVLPEPAGDVDAVQAIADAMIAMMAYLSRRLNTTIPQETTKEAWDRAIDRCRHQ